MILWAIVIVTCISSLALSVYGIIMAYRTFKKSNEGEEKDGAI